MIDQTIIKSAGLDYPTIIKHQERIKHALKDGESPQIPITDTCRLDNGGIMTMPKLNQVELQNIVAFVPAAGASSRYLASFRTLHLALQEQDLAAAITAAEALKTRGAQEWPLPAKLAEIIATPKILADWDDAALAEVLDLMNQPKALMPCTTEGDTFLEVKHREHQRLSSLVGEVFVIPPTSRKAFAAASQTTTFAEGPRTCFLQQGPQLSTLRFNGHGQPVLAAPGEPSIVPAGHGTLIGLFPQVREHFPKTQSLFIRNIDNVMGLNKPAVAATEQFLNTHQAVLNQVKIIRWCLAHGDYAGTLPATQNLLNWHLAAIGDGEEAFLEGCPADQRELWRTLFGFFNMNLPLCRKFVGCTELDGIALRKLFERPVNTMGQVPNNGSDIGGTPVFVRFGGVTQKLCIELPHASQEDLERFLKDPDKATHFNPVFVACELPSDPEYYEKNQTEMWVMAKKNFNNETVFYHETVLYEILGNNYIANTTFVEVPRCIFNPHKAVKDGSSGNRSFWGL